MLPILRDIRAVSGVTGVAIVVKHDGRMERFFPAAFTERHSEELQKMVTNAYQRLRGFTRLSLRFERVVVHIINQPEFLLFATVLPDVEESVFETVVRSKLPAISRALVRKAESSPKRSAGTPSERPSPVANRPPSGDVVRVLLDSFSRVTQDFGPQMGLSRVAGIWRESRDKITMENVAIASVEVDPVGQFSIRKGRYVQSSAANIESLAQIWLSFLSAVGAGAPDAEAVFFRCIEPYHDLLEYHGFFHFLKSHRRSGRGVTQ